MVELEVFVLDGTCCGCGRAGSARGVVGSSSTMEEEALEACDGRPEARSMVAVMTLSGVVGGESVRERQGRRVVEKGEP